MRAAPTKKSLVAMNSVGVPQSQRHLRHHHFQHSRRTSVGLSMIKSSTSLRMVRKSGRAEGSCRKRLRYVISNESIVVQKRMVVGWSARQGRGSLGGVISKSLSLLLDYGRVVFFGTLVAPEERRPPCRLSCEWVSSRDSVINCVLV